MSQTWSWNDGCRGCWVCTTCEVPKPLRIPALPNSLCLPLNPPSWALLWHSHWHFSKIFNVYCDPLPSSVCLQSRLTTLVCNGRSHSHLETQN